MEGRSAHDRTEVASPRSRSRRDDVAATDRLWLGITAVVFALSLALCFGAYAIYRATAPHPHVRDATRALKRAAHWLIPGL